MTASMVRVLLVVFLCACGSAQPAPSPASSPAFEPRRVEEPGACKATSSEAVELADLEHTMPPDTLRKLLVWIETHPEDAEKLADALKRKAEEKIAELRAQLARIERETTRRCARPIDGASISRQTSGTATFEGRVLLPTGLLPLAGADVELRAGSGVVATIRANGCGRFRFEGLAAGAYTLAFSTRSFRGRYDVTLGAAAAVTREFRVQVDGMRVAVVSGHYDAVEVILAALGIPFERLSQSCLGSAELARYQLVFVNCRHPVRLLDATVANLRSFVDGGGSIYFSDLTLPYAEQAWPELLTPARDGGAVETRPARIADRELAAFLGDRDRIDVRFNLGGWRRVSTSTPQMRVLVTDAERQGRPYMVLVPRDRGLVGFTSFHYAAQPLDDMVLSLVYFVTRL